MEPGDFLAGNSKFFHQKGLPKILQIFQSQWIGFERMDAPFRLAISWGKSLALGPMLLGRGMGDVILRCG